jgi:profilin
MQEVVTGLGGQHDKLFAEGLHVGGERYVVTKAEDRSLYGRKVGNPPPTRHLF